MTVERAVDVLKSPGLVDGWEVLPSYGPIPGGWANGAHRLLVSIDRTDRGRLILVTGPLVEGDDWVRPMLSDDLPWQPMHSARMLRYIARIT